MKNYLFKYVDEAFVVPANDISDAKLKLFKFLLEHEKYSKETALSYMEDLIVKSYNQSEIFVC